MRAIGDGCRTRLVGDAAFEETVPVVGEGSKLRLVTRPLCGIIGTLTRHQVQAMPIRSPEYMQQRRDHILDAALRCLQRQGLIDTSLTDICEEADISRGALYKHFASKDEILDGVFGKISQIAVNQLRFHDLPTMNSALTNWIDYIAGDGQKNLRLEFELMSLTRSNATLHAVVAFGIAQRQSTLEESFKALVHSGEIDEDIDIRATARALNAFLFGLFSLASVAQVPKAVRRATLNAFLHGVMTKAVDAKGELPNRNAKAK